MRSPAAVPTAAPPSVAATARDNPRTMSSPARATRAEGLPRPPRNCLAETAGRRAVQIRAAIPVARRTGGYGAFVRLRHAIDNLDFQLGADLLRNDLRPKESGKSPRVKDVEPVAI